MIRRSFHAVSRFRVKCLLNVKLIYRYEYVILGGIKYENG